MNATQFIVLDSRRCTACWLCVDECPKKVLKKFNILFHKHSRVDQPEACIGCKKCVKNCPNQAIHEIKLLNTTHHLGRRSLSVVKDNGMRCLR